MGMSWLLPRLVWQARTTELLLLNPRIGAQEAVRTGLAHRVAADPVAEAISIAEQLATLSPAAVAATLRLIRASGTTSLPEQLDREYRLQQTLWETQEARTAIAGLVARLRAGR
jgi:enoyl-CoA hydratase/carnithine racemase